ncbi:MAG: ATP-binding protein [Anaerolineae bacterium]
MIFLLAVEPDNCFRFVSVNKAFLTVTGLTEGQVVSKRIEEVLPETAHAMVLGKYNEAIRENKAVKWEEVSDYPTGKLTGEVIVTPAWDAAGVCTHLIGSVHDITEIRRAEEALQELNRELEERVAERTAELAVAKGQAESADRLKSTFLATMSHELRTPLNSIIGFTGIMLQGLAGPLNDEQTKQLGMVQSSASHLLDLINDILDISRIEAGQLEIACELFDMRASIQKAVRTITPLAEKKGLGLITEVSPEVGQIVSDRRRVEQILINLLNNAVKFTEAGEVRVECRIKDDWLVTRVIDTGIGIKPKDMPRLFEPFQQIDDGLTRRHEGTGLGLSICKRLVEMLGGEIWAESEGAGKGSAFAFTLPARLQRI